MKLNRVLLLLLFSLSLFGFNTFHSDKSSQKGSFVSSNTSQISRDVVTQNKKYITRYIEQPLSIKKKKKSQTKNNKLSYKEIALKDYPNYPLSLVADNDRVYILLKNYIIIYDKSRGKKIGKIKGFKKAKDMVLVNNHFYILGKNIIYIFDKKGNLLKKFGKKGREKGAFRSAKKITCSNDRIFIADNSKRKILVFTLDGEFIKSFKSPISYLYAFAYHDGILYLGGNKSYLYKIRSNDGKIISREQPNKDNSEVTAIEIDKNGNQWYGLYSLCVVGFDKDNHFIQSFGKNCGGKIKLHWIFSLLSDNNLLYIGIKGRVIIVPINNTKKVEKELDIKIKSHYKEPFIWSDKVEFAFINNLLWQDTPIDGKDYKKACFNYPNAVKYCNNLNNNFFGIKLKYRLPTIDELIDASKDKTQFTYIKDGNPYWSQTSSGDYHKALVIGYGYQTNKVEKYVSFSCASVRCVAKNRIKLSGSSFDKVVENILQGKYFKYKTKQSRKPILEKPRKLIKDEFETTKEFQDRVAKEKRRVEKINREKMVRYKMAIQSLTPPISKKRVLQAAFFLMYGKPMFKEVHYDADNEKFHIKIVSSKNNFVKNFTIFIPRKDARAYKKYLLSKQPTITIAGDGRQLYIAAIDEFHNPDYIAQSSALANANTIDDVRKFIKTHPHSKLLTQAKNKLNFLKQKEKDLFKKVYSSNDIYKMKKYLKEHPNSKFKKVIEAKIDKLYKEERYRREKAQRERALDKQRRLEAKKSVGDLVCLDGKMYFGLINVTIKGYVDAINPKNGKIKIRIVDTQGTTPRFHGIELTKGTMIWDYYNHWTLCD